MKFPFAFLLTVFYGLALVDAGCARASQDVPHISIKSVAMPHADLAHAAIWRNVSPVSDFKNIQGGTDAISRTECRFAQTPLDFIAQCIAFENPRGTRASTNPADIQKGDNVAIGLSLNDDPKSPIQYVFFANPKGTSWATGTVQQNFTGRWSVVVTTTPTTWITTFVIPFSSLKIPPVQQQSWHIGIVRVDSRNGTAWVWPSIAGKNAMKRLSPTLPTERRTDSILTSAIIPFGLQSNSGKPMALHLISPTNKRTSVASPTKFWRTDLPSFRRKASSFRAGI